MTLIQNKAERVDPCHPTHTLKCAWTRPHSSLKQVNWILRNDTSAPLDSPSNRTPSCGGNANPCCAVKLTIARQADVIEKTPPVCVTLPIPWYLFNWFTFFFIIIKYSTFFPTGVVQYQKKMLWYEAIRSSSSMQILTTIFSMKVTPS